MKGLFLSAIIRPWTVIIFAFILTTKELLPLDPDSLIGFNVTSCTSLHSSSCMKELTSSALENCRLSGITFDAV